MRLVSQQGMLVSTVILILNFYCIIDAEYGFLSLNCSGLHVRIRSLKSIRFDSNKNRFIDFSALRLVQKNFKLKKTLRTFPIYLWEYYLSPFFNCMVYLKKILNLPAQTLNPHTRTPKPHSHTPPLGRLYQHRQVSGISSISVAQPWMAGPHVLLITVALLGKARCRCRRRRREHVRVIRSQKRAFVHSTVL